MQIDAIDVFHLGLPLVQPLSTAVGPVERLETVVVRLRSGQTSGWGEVAPGSAPLAGPEWAAGVFACVRDWLAPALVGRWIDSGKSLQERLAPFQGNRHAKAALDLAWWDLKARAQGQPLYRLLGGQREAIELGVSFDRMDSIDQLLAAMRAAVEAGYSRVELKLRPGWDVFMLNAVRQEFPVLPLHVDIEGTMRLEHSELLYRMDDFHLKMVEQPLAPDDLVGHAMIQQALRTPICLDESITTPEQAAMALDLQSGQYLNLKPGQVGGFTPALAVHDACHEHCVPCRVGTPLQSSLGVRASLALATKANVNYPTDFFASAEVLQGDLAPPPAVARDPESGHLQAVLGPEPGLGVEPDPQALEQYALARESLGG